MTTQADATAAPMTRIKASLIHLLLVGVVLGAILFVVITVWYPGLTFRIAGAMKPVLLLVGISLAVGPLFTLIVYKHGKAGMTFDLVVIAMLQVGALTIGTYVLYQERPGYLVFAVDRFNLIAEIDVDSSQIDDRQLSLDSNDVPVLVHARLPDDPDVRQQLLEDVAFEGQPDLEYRVEFWEPYSFGADALREAVTHLDDFEARSDRDAAVIADVHERHEAHSSRLGVLPIGKLDEDLAMLIDLATLQPIDVLEVDAWGIVGED